MSSPTRGPAAPSPETRRTRLLSQLALSWLAFVLGALAAIAGYAPVLLAILALGAVLGIVLAGLLSRPRNELGLVPLGALGLLLALLQLAWAWLEGSTPSAGLIAAAGLGLSAGLSARPLAVLVIEREGRLPPPWMALAVIAGLGWSTVLAKAGLGSGQLTLVLALTHAAAALLMLALMPEFLMRFLVLLLVHVLYRVRAQGLENIPQQGAAIVACNHVSYVDAVIVGALSQRPIRFVMYHRIFRIPLLSFVFRTARAIPIAPAREDEAMLTRAYEEIEAALQGGELIGIFPEGALTPDGQIQPFRPGIEKILARCPAPVVPMALRGLWRSMWSRRAGRFGRSRLPRRFRARVELVVEPAMTPDTVSAGSLEARIRALRGAAA